MSSRSFGRTAVPPEPFDQEPIRTTPQFHAAYVGAFDLYVTEPSEAALHIAYELGRRAVELRLSLPELARVHHAAVDMAFESPAGRTALVVQRGAEFLAECLSAFEMVQRGYAEAHERVLEERRHASVLRRLSSFLGDTSLAFDPEPSLTETLNLIAEAARELTRARCCIASVELPSIGRDPVTVVSGDAVPGLSAATIVADMNELGGRKMGQLVVVAAEDETFAPSDEAILGQLAEMGGAALERAYFYAAH